MAHFLGQFPMITNFPGNLLLELKNLSIASELEIVGFIKDNIFQQVNNIHPDSKNYFLINSKDIKDLNSGYILFHSHPIHIELDGFSEWDLENQKYSCIPMLLYSVKADKFYYSPC